MKRFKRAVIALVVAAVALTPLSAATTPAHAASPYDDVIQVAESLTITSTSNPSCVKDLSMTWDGDIRSVLSGSSMLTSFENKAAWSVSVRYTDLVPTQVYVQWWEASSLPVVATINWSTIMLFTGGVNQATLWLDPVNGCTVTGSWAPIPLPIIQQPTSTFGGVRPFLIYGVDIEYPEGYEGEMVPETWAPPTPTYVAMGDSFSSGEGNSPFEAGTDTATNKCHRSEAAYPHWISQTPGLVSGPMAFVACSGAETSHILGGQAGEPPQVDVLSVETEIVTITIGGNDIGFVDFAYECVVSDCSSTTSIYMTTISKINNDLSSGVSNVLNSIATKTDEARVFVIGYPYVTPGIGLDNLPFQCSIYLSSSESLAARTVVEELNSKIESTVLSFVNSHGDTTFTFVNPNLSVDGTFDGHDVCQGTDSYFHNVTPNDAIPGGNGYREKIFHPNITGQYEYYKIVSGAIEYN